MIIGSSAFVANNDSYFSKIEFLNYFGMVCFFAFFPLHLATATFAFWTKAYSIKHTILLMVFIPVVAFTFSGIISSML